MENFKPAKLRKTKAEPLSDVLKLFVLQSGLGKGLYRQAVIKAWNKVSGASEVTSNCFLRDGTLSVTISSSVVRSRLLFQKEWLLQALNAELEDDEQVKMSGITTKIEKLILH